MDNGDTPVVAEPKKQQENNGLTGFQLHPENINKEGRPRKGYAISDVIRDMMDEQPEIKKALGAKLIQLALGGDLQAINAVMDRLEGKPNITAQVTNLTPPTPIYNGKSEE